MRVGRVLLRLTDTAGIREAGDAIEALGVARSEQAAREAELAMFVCDASQPLTDEDRRAIEAAKCAPRSLALCNKSDLPAAVSPDELPFDTVLTVSARTGAGLDALPALLEGWFLGENACDGSLLTNPRQFGAPTAPPAPSNGRKPASASASRRTPFSRTWRRPWPPSVRSRGGRSARISQIASLSDSVSGSERI